MRDVRYWFGWLPVILVFHGIEQLLFGFDELYELQGQVGAVLGLFANRDAGIIVLVFAVVLLVQLFVYTLLSGGRWRLLGPTFFAVAALGESHHIIKTIFRLDYFPGAVTAIPYVVVGALRLSAGASARTTSGRPAGPVMSGIAIVPYDERWPGEFDRVATVLRRALGAQALRVDHIGSTSVPGLSAKDVIDIQVSVREFAPAISDALLAAGFVRYPDVTADHVPPGFDGVPGEWSKWLFVQPQGQRRANIHIRRVNKPNQRYALLVRDFLRANPTVAKAYADLKTRLAAALANPADYPEVKDPAVDLIYLAAEVWADRAGWQQQ
jgi:GrpB-like predicted nucleotidyltransferase (UPF0157 family)